MVRYVHRTPTLTLTLSLSLSLSIRLSQSLSLSLSLSLTRFDMSIGGEAAGRIRLGLFGEVRPLTPLVRLTRLRRETWLGLGLGDADDTRLGLGLGEADETWLGLGRACA